MEVNKQTKSTKNKASKPKPKKKPAKYHEKIKIKGSFDEVMNILAKPKKGEV